MLLRLKKKMMTDERRETLEKIVKETLKKNRIIFDRLHEI